MFVGMIYCPGRLFLKGRYPVSNEGFDEKGLIPRVSRLRKMHMRIVIRRLDTNKFSEDGNELRLASESEF